MAFWCKQCSIAAPTAKCPGCNHLLSNKPEDIEQFLQEPPLPGPSEEWLSMFAHWGDTLASLGYAKWAAGKLGREKFSVVYCGPDQRIVELIEAQPWIDKVLGCYPKDFDQIYRRSCSPGAAVNSWYPAMRGPGFPETVFPAQTVSALGGSFKYHPQRIEGLPEQSREWATKWWEKHGSAETYLLNPMSTWSQNASGHWPHWRQAVDWLLDNTDKTFALIGLEKYVTRAHPRLLDLVGKVPSNLEVMALAELAAGSITTCNSLACWTSVRGLDALVCGNNAIRFASMYFRRMVDAGRNIFLPVEAGLQEWVEKAEVWIDNPTGAVQEKDRQMNRPSRMARDPEESDSGCRVFYRVVAPCVSGFKEDYRTGAIVEAGKLNGGPDHYVAYGLITVDRVEVPPEFDTDMQKEFNDIPERLEPFLAAEDRDSDFVKSGNYYDWYATYAKNLKPKKILEIGVRYGYSALAMLWGAGDTVEDLVLIDSGAYGVPLTSAMTTLRKGYKKKVQVVPIVADSQTMTKLSAETGVEKFDLIHIDGDHTVEGMTHDLELCLPMLADNGLIVVDDVFHHPALLPAGLRFALRENLTAQVVKTLRGHLLLTAGAGDQF